MNILKPQKGGNHALPVQIWLVTLLVVMFVDLAALSPFTSKHNLSTAYILLGIALNTLFLTISAYIIYNNRASIGHDTLYKMKAAVKQPVFVLLVIYIIVKLFYLDTMQRWDGAWYFCRLLESVKGFDFTLGNFINNFNWFGHPSMGFGFLMSLGQFIDPGNHYILNIQYLILAVLAVFSFYKILAYLYGNNKTEILLLTALFAFNPLFFGVSLSFNSDFPLVVFWLAFMYALLYERFILASFCCMLLVFSKETGALIYFTFLFSLLLIFVARKVFFNAQRPLCIPRKINVTSVACLVLPLLTFIIFFLYRQGQLWGGGSLGWDSNGFHVFGLNWASFKTTCLQIFVLDFSWIMCFIILLYLGKTILFTRKKPPSLNENQKDLLMIHLFIFTVFLTFNLLYITFNHPRYVLLAVVFLLLFAYHALTGLAKSKALRIVILSLMLVLFTAQTFRTVDPLSKLAFGTTFFGEHEVLAINPADGMVYNAEYTVIDKLLDKFIQETKINTNSQIILSDNGWNAHFNGAGRHTTISINKENLKRTFKTANTFQPQTFSVADISSENKPQKPIYLSLSWFGDEAAELAHLQKYYRVLKANIIEHKGYFFKAYYLE